jgi:hypothetical protein
MAFSNRLVTGLVSATLGPLLWKSINFSESCQTRRLVDKICREDSRDDTGGRDSDNQHPTSLHQAVYAGNREIFDFILHWPNSLPES